MAKTGELDRAHPERVVYLLVLMPFLFSFGVLIGLLLGVRGQDLIQLSLALITTAIAALPLILDQGRPPLERHVLLSTFSLVFILGFVLPVLVIFMPAEGPIEAPSFAWSILFPIDVIRGQLATLLGLACLLIGYASPVGRVLTGFLPRFRSDWPPNATLAVAGVIIPLGWAIQLRGLFTSVRGPGQWVLRRPRVLQPLRHCAPVDRVGVRRLVADRTDLASLRVALVSEDYDVVHDVTAYRPEDVAFMLEHFRGRTGHYVFVSSTVIYAASDLLPIHEDFPVDRSPQQNEYGRNKLLCEDLLVRAHREHGFPATTVALSMVFGPHNILPDREQRMFVRLLAGRPILIPGDGTTLAQVGHVDDQARALRMLMGNPRTFGRRYNLTGNDYFTAEGYVDSFARVVGVEPNKVFIPAPLMDELFDGRTVARPVQEQAKIDIRSSERPDEVQKSRFLLSMLVQRIAPHIHRWNAGVIFGVERLRQDVGFEPEVRFPAAVAETYEWFQAERVAEKQSFDFSFEDELLRLTKERGAA